MKWIRNFFYHLKQGFVSIFRNGVMSFASVLVLVSCMLILGTFYLIVANIEENFNSIDNLNVIEVRIPNTYTTDQVDQVEVAIQTICDESPIISQDPVFVSSAEHLERFQKLYSDQAWSSFFNEELNPLRPSFEITFDNFSDITEVVQIVSQIEAIQFDDGTMAIQASDIESCIDVYRNVMSVKNTLYTVGAWMLVILMVISLFVITNTIKLGIFARRNEIMFMRYCGATKHFIRAPFLVEGCIIGIFSAAVSLGLEFLVYQYALKGIVSDAGSVISGGAISISPFADHIWVLIVAFVIIGLFAGLISGTISLKKYLKV